MKYGVAPRLGIRSQSFLERFRRKSILLQFVTMIVIATLIPGPGYHLMAAPPLEIQALGADRIQLSWPETAEEVYLEASGDLGQNLPWLPYAIPPILSDGRFSQEVEADSVRSFFRLVDGNGGSLNPVFNNPPPANPSLFPGEVLSFTLSATDPGGAPVSYLASPLPLPAGASLNMSTGEFRWTPSEDQIGLTTITFKAYNGVGSGLLPTNITVKQPPLNGTTSLSGLLLDTTNAVNGEQIPIVGAVVSLLDSGITATTGADGRFTLSGIPGGLQVLDLATASADPAPDGSAYAGFREAIKIVAGIPNNVTRPFYLPRLAMGSLKKVNPDFTTMVENIDLGVSIVVPPHTAMMGDEEFTGDLSISLVPEALAPAALPGNLGFGQLVTIQPVGVRFTEPVAITFRNIDMLPPGTETDIWSLDPDAGIFAVVGTGRVTADGQFIETIEGGVIAADWHGNLPPGADGSGGPSGPGGPCGGSAAGGGAPGVGGSPGSAGPGASGAGGGAQCQVEGLAPSGPSSGAGGSGGSGADGGSGSAKGPGPNGCPANSGSSVSILYGGVGTDFVTPHYVTQGQARYLQFVYSSHRASPSAILPVELTIPSRSAVPRSVSLTGTLGGIQTNNGTFFSTEGFSESRDEKFLGSVFLDAKSLDTGLYPYVLDFTSHFTNSSIGGSLSDNVVVVNGSDSPYGAGWGIAGHQKLHRIREQQVLIEDGDGSHVLFSTLNFSGLKIASFGSGRCGELSIAEGSRFSQARDLMASTFSGTILTAIDELTIPNLSGVSVLLLHPYTSATQGNLLSSSEQVALQNFIKAGGSVVIMSDHDVGRSSFKEAITGLLSPFGIVAENESTSPLEITDGNPDFINGIFGSLGQIDLPFGGSHFTNLGPNAVASALSGSKIVACSIPPGEIGPGSGIVHFLPDVQGMTNNLSSNTSALFLNTVASALLSAQDENVFTAPGESSEVRLQDDGTYLRTMDDGRTYRFTQAGTMSAMEDRNGNRTTYNYANGLLTKITDPTGNSINLTYSGGNLTQVLNSTMTVARFRHDAEGNLIETSLPDGAKWTYQYDHNGLLVGEIDPEGGQTTRIYDQYRRGIQFTLPDGSTRTASHTDTLGLPDEGFGTEQNPFIPVRPDDAWGSYTDAGGHLFEARFDPDGTFSTRADGMSARIQYDDRGHLSALDTTSGERITAKYDLQGNPIEQRDENTGAVSKWSYDSAHHFPLSYTNVLGNTFNYEYDAALNPLAVTTPEGRRLENTFNGEGLPTSLSGFHFPDTSYRYDAQQNLSRIDVDVAGNTVSTNLTYSGNGLLKSVSGPNGSVGFEYDSSNRLTEYKFPDNSVARMSYDLLGNLRGITPAGRPEHRFHNNEIGLLLRYVPPTVPDGTGEINYEYNEASQLIRETRSGQEAYTLEYDDSGRMIKVRDPRGSTDYVWDAPTGKLLSIASPEGQLFTFSRTRDRVDGGSWTGEINGQVAYSYDLAGQTTAVTLNGTDTINTSYDRDGLMTKVGAVDISRDANTGRPTTLTSGAVTEERKYYSGGLLKSKKVRTSAQDLLSAEFTYDQRGNVATVVETRLGTTRNLAYAYDSLGRLITASVDGTISRYTYDTNGNRLTADRGGQLEQATYDNQDRLLTLNGKSFTYDAFGQLRQSSEGGAITIYRYDTTGNLMKIEKPNGSTVDYVVDGFGRRIGKKDNGTLTEGYLYSSDRTIAGIVGGDGSSLTASFGYEDSSETPIFLRKQGQNYRIIEDHTGTPILAINTATGDVVRELLLDEFGRTIRDTNPGFIPLGFAGGIADAGLVRFGSRDYDPTAGRWTAKDSILFGGGSFNLYAYANNNPVNLRDEDGRCVDKFLFVLAVTGLAIFLYGVEKFGKKAKAAIDSGMDKMRKGRFTDDSQSTTKEVLYLGAEGAHNNPTIPPATGVALEEAAKQEAKRTGGGCNPPPKIMIPQRAGG